MTDALFCMFYDTQGTTTREGMVKDSFSAAVVSGGRSGHIQTGRSGKGKGKRIDERR